MWFYALFYCVYFLLENSAGEKSSASSISLDRHHTSSPASRYNEQPLLNHSGHSHQFAAKQERDFPSSMQKTKALSLSERLIDDKTRHRLVDLVRSCMPRGLKLSSALSAFQVHARANHHCLFLVLYHVDTCLCSFTLQVCYVTFLSLLFHSPLRKGRSIDCLKDGKTLVVAAELEGGGGGEGEREDEGTVSTHNFSSKSSVFLLIILTSQQKYREPLELHQLGFHNVESLFSIMQSCLLVEQIGAGEFFLLYGHIHVLEFASNSTSTYELLGWEPELVSIILAKFCDHPNTSFLLSLLHLCTCIKKIPAHDF